MDIDCIEIFSWLQSIHISNLNLGNSVEKIYDYAFNNCAISEIAFPSSVKYLGSYSFATNAITELALPTTIEYIGEGVFLGCPIETLNIDYKEIGNGWFQGLGTLKTVKFGDSVESIGEYAFADCGLSEISFPTTLQTIGNSAFLNCKISQLELPASLSSIDGSAFYGNPISSLIINCNIPLNINNVFSKENLTKVVFGDNVEIVPSFAYSPLLSDVTLPSALTYLSDNAFYNCGSITELTLPENLMHIGEGALYGTGITHIDLPSTLSTIGDRAFAYTKLSTIDFPDKLTFIGKEAFISTRLTSINIPESVSFIGELAFCWCTELTTFTLPKTITYINDQVFMGCSNLKDIKLHEKIESIGNWAFSFCELTNFDIPESVTTIGDNAFAHNKLSFINLKKNLTMVGENAFMDNPLEKVYVGTSAAVEGTFPNDNLIEAIFEEDAVTIPDFSGAQKLKDVTLPPLMEMLPANSFKDCIALEKVVFTEGLKSIGDEAFMNCSNLTKLNIPKSVLSFGEGTFRNCTNLRSMIIPDGMEKIAANLMEGCMALTEILIPNSIISIGDNAFSGCSSLKNIDLGTGIYDIGNYAFSECPNIINIHSMAKFPPFASQYTFPIVSYTKATVTVQEQSLTRYNQETPWYRFNNYLTVSGAVSLSHYQVDMAANEVFQLGVYGATGEIEWTSSNPSVAYANKCGLIVAMGITGSTTITAHVDGEEINCRVTVSAQKRETRAKVRAYANTAEIEAVNPVEIYMEGVSGNPPMVNVRLVPIGASTVIDWTTSDDSLATVENGIVTIHGDGDVEFGAETENGLGESCYLDTNFNVGTGIQEIFSSCDCVNPTNDVYDLTGRLVIANATSEQIQKLNAGIYIVNGKKILVK